MAEFTREAYDQLVKERERVEEEFREASLAVGDTVDGDPNAWHDNFSFDDATRRVHALLGRRDKLDEMIRNAIVVDKLEPHSEVMVGSHVEVSSSDGVKAYIIGGEFNVRQTNQDGIRVLSTKSPLGRALLGHEKGDTVRYHLPKGGEREVTVENVW